MKLAKSLRVSFNGQLIDKQPPTETRFYAHGFEPDEVYLGELEENIQLGFAFSYQFENGYRVSEGFLASDILVVDIDGGLKIDECLKLPIVESFCSLLYTTVSNTIDHHRYRLIFALPRTITDPNELSFASKALAQRLGGDPRSTTPAALFMGSTDCHIERIGNAITDGFLDELIEDGSTIVANDSVANNRPTANRSRRSISGTLSIVLPDGSKTTFRQIAKSRPVYCPFHRDERPRAFVGQGQGGRFLSCQRCKKTWWEGGKKQSDGKFHEFDDLVRALKSGAVAADPDELKVIELHMGEDRIIPRNIRIVSEQYLDPKPINQWNLSEGVTFVKSPKGTGKTTFLADLVKHSTTLFNSLEDYERGDDIESPVAWYTSEKVLLIGHRQALIGELCQRLGLYCYLEDKPDESPGILNERMKRYGVCLDSLKRVENKSYDIVVIDEVEQVLAHFLADTLGEKRRRIFQEFSRIVREAKHTIVLDADLSWPTFKTIQLIKTLPFDEFAYSRNSVEFDPVRIYLNEWKDENRTINVYDSHDHLVDALKEAVLSGKRVFVTSNSKRKIDALEQVVKQLAEESKQEIPSVSITSANSKSAEIQALIRNIKVKILDYRVILSSPSLGTGVDITFENDRQEIDCVFGFFEARVTSHFEIDQQLARVRHPKEVNVWVSPQRFNFETEFEVVVDDVLRSDLVYSAKGAFGWTDRKAIAAMDPFLTTAALVVSKDRASKNRLKSNFIDYKQEQGWTVNVVAKDILSAQSGLAVLEQGKIRSRQEVARRLLNAKVLDEAEFQKVKDRLEFATDVVTMEERSSFDRTRLELFYQEKASHGLIEYDDQSRMRDRILLFEALIQHRNNPEEYKGIFEYPSNRKITRARAEILKSRLVGAALLSELFSCTPLFRNGQFVSDAEYSTADFSQFIERSKKVRRFVEGQFGIATRRDIDKKPIQHLTALLKLVGLENEYTRKTRSKSGTVYFYRVDPVSLATVQEIAKKRAVSNKWTSINERYGFTEIPDDYS